MLNSLKKLFAVAETPQQVKQDNLQRAAAALLVEAAVMDGTFGEDERAVVLRLLKDRFDLSVSETETLLGEAETAISESNELYTLTRTIKENFEHSERVELIEMLWEVAYADGELHDYESNLVRRLSGLLYVSDRDSGEARKRVLERLST
ncbi:TerB family tellurite resistance protein [Magnetovibrio sp.]|uniref:tellurite resistance TerB family protein n=1 Tax=Magnetovibrio sp. TaxID=2024836 RepID=UPI002F952C27